MAQFFEGRDQIGSPFFLETDCGNERVQCTAFKRWIETNQGITLRCGRDANIEISKTVGLGELKSETSEDSVEGTLGVSGLAQLKSEMKAILGHEISWNRATTTKASLYRKAPPCGRYELAVHQLVREYDFQIYRRGMWPFRHDTWDLKGQRRGVREYTEVYDLIEDDFEFDERCRNRASCKAPATAPDYEGRIALHFGDVSVNVPYRVSAGGFITIRLGRDEIPIKGLNAESVDRAQLQFPLDLVPEIVRFLGDLTTETVIVTTSYASRFRPAEPAVVSSESTGEIQRAYEVDF